MTVENKEHGIPRLESLRNIPAKVRFLSVEPLLEDLGQIDLTGVHWVIVGGESGYGYRPMKLDWVLSIKEQCVEQNVPFFFKQFGGHPNLHDCLLNGVEVKEWPKYILA